MNKNIDLSVVKRLVQELESALEKADTLNNKDSVKIGMDAGPNLDYIVQMNVATGLAAGIMTEASLLMGDIQGVLKDSQVPSKSDLIEKLLGGLKMAGSKN